MPDFGKPELDDQEDVDEQAGQDLRQRGHRLDDGADQARSPGLRPRSCRPRCRCRAARRSTTAMPTSMTVPTMAWKMPPWVSGAVGETPAMSCVKKLRWTRACQPLDERVDDRGAEGEDDDGGRDHRASPPRAARPRWARVGHRQDHGRRRRRKVRYQQTRKPTSAAEVQQVQVADDDQREGRQQGADERRSSRRW